MNKSYYLRKDSKNDELMILEFEKIEGYSLTPKVKIDDAIEVNKIVLINPSLRKKIIEKKVEIKIRYFLKLLRDIDENGSDEGNIKLGIMEAEKLRISIINRYVKYFGNTFASYSLQKIQLIINQLNMRLYRISFQKKMASFLNQDLYYLDRDETMKGRGR